MASQNANIISALQADILRLEGHKSSSHTVADFGLGAMRHAFHHSVFPLNAVHEFLPDRSEDMAATDGFVAGMLASLMGSSGACLWISTSRTIFPPALMGFGIQPHRVIFVEVAKERDVLWTMEEALKCGAMATVVGELKDMDFTASRRLQLAVEQSGVTGFILRQPRSKLKPTACFSRWKIRSLSSETIDGLPGVGFPQWRAELMRVRNGRPGVWDVKWKDGRFQPVHMPHVLIEDQKRKAG